MRKLGFTLGADPECSVVCNNFQINACELANAFSEFGKYISRSMGVKVPGGEFGFDGCDSTAELRPSPGFTPKALTENIGEILSTVGKETNGFVKLITQSVTECNGGHVHISMPSHYIKHNRYGAQPSKRARNVIRWTLFLSLPLTRLTSSVTRKNRAVDGYGNLSDVRYGKRGNGIYTAELRFLSAEWLTTPKLTEAVLSYIACVHYEARHNRNLSKMFSAFTKDTDLDSLEYYPFLSHFCEDIENRIKSFALYNQYKSAIKYVLNYEKVRQDLEAVGYDALSGWKIKSKTPTLRKFLSTKVKEYNDYHTSVFDFLVSESCAIGDGSELESGLRSMIVESKLVPKQSVRVCITDTPKPISFVYNGVYRTDAEEKAFKKLRELSTYNQCIIGVSPKTSLSELAEYYYKLQNGQINHRVMR